MFTVDPKRALWLWMVAGCASTSGSGAGPSSPPPPAAEPLRVLAPRFAALALSCVHREYPNKVAHVMVGPEDVGAPHELTPAFYGCFDWHSAVHGHWLLVRLLRAAPGASFATGARKALGRSLTTENLAAEVAYIGRDHRTGFERPYGLAWLLQLAAELRAWDDPDGRRWYAALQPLEALAAERLAAWLPRLSHPIRSGEHSQTAFAMGLWWDWAHAVGDDAVTTLIRSRALEFHGADPACDLAFEPSGHDFLSPCLAEADLMRRVMPGAEFSRWLSRVLPTIDRAGDPGWLPVARTTDRADGKLAHLDGLNLSRAWMLEGIAAGLPTSDPRLPALHAAAAAHRRAGLAATTGEHYAGGHWLGSFAVYLVTGRGLEPD